MGSEPKIRQELAEERRELKAAVAELRQELGHAAERGKKVGAGIGAATGAAVFAKLLLKLRRR
jgi:cell division septum initiation protein DivIVA